jgi:hypothetical protein
MPPAGAASAPRLVWDVSEQGESLLTALFPHLAGLRVHRVEDIRTPDIGRSFMQGLGVI